MENNHKRTYSIIIIVAAIAISLIIVTVAIVLSNHKIKSEPWILQSYGNNVALFNGNEIIEVYGAIMIDTLPEYDKKMLDNGISFLTKEEAITAIEDYDG